MRIVRLSVLLVAVALPPALNAATPAAADDSIDRFLAQDEAQHSYRAVRRLEGSNGDRAGWVEAMTDFSPQTGFRYQVTAEDGSSYIRTSVLRAVLDGERELIARGETARFALAHANYTFEARGVDPDGLAQITLSPRREDRVLVSGTMFVRPSDGELVRLQGRLVKSPSWWVKHVDISRLYQRIHGVVVPIALHSTAQLRLFGAATLRMTYRYLEIDGRPVAER